MKFLPTKGPNFYKSCKGSRSQTISELKHGPHSSVNTGEAGYFLVLLKHGTRLEKCLCKAKFRDASQDKGNWSFSRISFSSQFLSHKEVKVTLYLSVTDFFSPYGKAEYQLRENTWYLVSINPELLPWQAYHSEFNEKNSCRHQIEKMLTIVSQQKPLSQTKRKERLSFWSVTMSLRYKKFISQLVF